MRSRRSCTPIDCTATRRSRSRAPASSSIASTASRSSPASAWPTREPAVGPAALRRGHRIRAAAALRRALRGRRGVGRARAHRSGCAAQARPRLARRRRGDQGLPRAQRLVRSPARLACAAQRAAARAHRSGEEPGAAVLPRAAARRRELARERVRQRQFPAPVVGPGRGRDRRVPRVRRRHARRARVPRRPARGEHAVGRERVAVARSRRAAPSAAHAVHARARVRSLGSPALRGRARSGHARVVRAVSRAARAALGSRRRVARGRALVGARRADPEAELAVSAPLRVDWLQVLQTPLRMAHALQVIRSADALARRGHEVRVFVRGGAAEAALETALGRAPAARLRAVELPAHKGLAGLALRASIARFALGARGERAWIARELRLARFALRFGVPLVFEFHNLEHVLAAETGRAAEAERTRADERRIAARAHGLIAISAPLAEDIARELAPPREVAVVPDGVDLAAFAPHTARVPLGAPIRVAYAGSLYAHKGVDALLEMSAELARRAGAGAFRLAIAGGEPASELARLRAHARADLVEFTGSLDPRAVPEFLQRADVLVLPSGAESRSQRYTSPLKLFEALASGVPIVAAPSVAHRSVLDEAQIATLAAGSSGAELAAAVLALCADPVAAREQARRARAAAERYSWDARAAALERALAAAIAGASR
ncbi:MAG: glycosyltransferase [Planctomycetota bacterium]|nr:MAG: glycosyltransferase [Planctomycetota bacterium]